jgi:flagellar M-ring protein FliF
MATTTQLEKVTPARTGQPGFFDRLAALWTLARVRWAQMAAAHRRGAMASALLLAALTGAILWFALRTDWSTLYTGLEPGDARETGVLLTQAQIPYDLAADGTTIRVPAALLDKARLTAAAGGGSKTGRMGFEIFDKPNWVGSEFDEQVNYQRALEGELEHTIGTLSDIESARVHLVLPHESLFREDQRPAKASVVLKLRHGALADGEPDAIRNLVAAAVDGLSADHVVLVDAAGHLPLGPKTPEALRAGAEQALEDKLIATLDPVTGPGNVRASVSLDYDPAETDVTQESYDPSQTVTLASQKSEQTSGSQPIPAGVPGTASNAPNTQALPVYPQGSSQPQSSKTESDTFAASKTVKHILENPGRLRRMTAAIVINDRLVTPATKTKAAVWQPHSADELRHLTALAQAAVGFDATRGDAVTVEDMAFDDNRPAQPVPAMQQMLGAAGNAMKSSPELIQYGALLFGLVAVLILGVRPALKHAGAALRESAQPRGGKLAAGAAGGGLPAPAALAESDPERARAQAIFDQVSGHVKREPAQSSRLLQSWIHTE